jgi:hypothetical protein
MKTTTLHKIQMLYKIQNTNLYIMFETIFVTDGTEVIHKTAKPETLLFKSRYKSQVVKTKHTGQKNYKISQKIL